MKIGWGWKIMILYLGFMGMIIALVAASSNQKIDLVSKDYYKDEIAYQEVIYGTKNANALHAKATVKESATDVVIQLPEEMKNHSVKGTVLFYCPSNMENDRHLTLSTDADGKQTIELKKFSKGNYTVKIDWQDATTHFYTERPLTIL